MARTHRILYTGASIGSVSVLAKALGVTEQRLIGTLKRGKKNYLIFDKNIKGKDRNLSEPLTELKILLKRILNRIFCHIQYPHYLYGGVKADDPRDFLTNASAHAKAKVVIALDVKNFFPSIEERIIKDALMRLCRFPSSVAEILSKLVSLENKLPQGSPTSTAIANIVMFDREYKLASAFENQGLVYTRLIDDITISCASIISPEKITKIIDKVSRMVSSYGFALHPDKTSVKSRSNSQELMTVTGLWLNRGTPKLLPSKRSQISKEVVDLYKRGKNEGRYCPLFHTAYNSISGKVALLSRLRHSRASRLRGLLDQVVPLHDDHAIAKVSFVVGRFCRRKNDANSYGAIKKFYRLQSQVAIVKRTQPLLAARLQKELNKVRPTQTLKGIYA